MARPSISTTKLNDYLSISECHPTSECRTNNWWVYDKRAEKNICREAKTRDVALVEAIDYWSKRALLAEQCYSDLKNSVDIFVSQFAEPEEERYED